MKLNFKRTVMLLLLGSTSLFEASAAVRGACYAYTDGAPSNPNDSQIVTYPYSVNYIDNITDPSQNYAGKTILNAYTWDLGGKFTGKCYCPSGGGGTSSRNIIYLAKFLPTETYTSGGRVFAKINNYLAAGADIHVGGLLDQMVQAPFEDVDNQGSAVATNFCNIRRSQLVSGSKGIVHLYFIRPFVGVSVIPPTDFVALYGRTSFGSYDMSHPMSKVTISGQVTVPQSCQIDAGTVIPINFGKIAAQSFKQKGVLPDGVQKWTETLKIACQNISDGMDIEIHFDASSGAAPGYSDAIATNHPDIGIIIEDENGNVIKPGTGNIPVDLDISNSNGTVTINTYPVKVTDTPITQLSTFRGIATIRFDFR